MKWPKSLGFPAVVKSVETKGILNPLVWICGLSYASTVITAFSSSHIVWLFGALDLIITLWILRAYDFFREHNPMYMFTEDHQYRMARHQQSANRALERDRVLNSLPAPNPYLQNESKDSQSDA